MFGLFKKKVTRADIVTSDIGFHTAFNYCREVYDHRLFDGFSKEVYLQVLRSAMQAIEGGANKLQLYQTILSCFDLPSSQMQFLEAVDKIVSDVNKLRGKSFEETRNNVIANRLSVNSIKDSLKQSEGVSD